MKVVSSILLLLFLLGACKNPVKQRSDAEAGSPVKEVVQPSQRPIDTEDIVVPEGYRIEAVQTGLSYPVDVAFDEEGNTYIAEAGGHTYGTKPARAPEARILKVSPNGSVEILYDKVVPMTNVKKNVTSSKMQEGLIRPVTGVTYHEGSMYIAHRSRYSVYNLETGEFKTIVNGLPSWGEFLNAKPIFKDNKMYFFLSTQGNSGVIEEHFAEVLNEFDKPEATLKQAPRKPSLILRG